MNVRVTSVSKREQKLGDAPAAVFVITQDDIRRSGARNIPEALRMVPGLEVARIDENKWAIGARGFNGRFANKLLVLIDGRSVYTPLFSGVYWDIQDVPLEDIDRIEVIRGPGATLWGANAVNGVINIVTRSARDTRGAYVRAGGGREDPGIVEARYGGSTGSTAFRAYAKYAARSAQTYSDGTSAGDRRGREQAGFRVDGGNAGSSSWFVKGDLFHSIDHLPDRANA